MKKVFLGYFIMCAMVVGFLSASITYAAPTLARTSVTVGLGQSVTVVAQGSVGVYATSNSSPSIANVQTNGQQITVTGYQIGGTTAVICHVGTASDCTNLNITVQTSAVQTLTFSQSSVTLTPGQSASVTVSNGGGAYGATGNSNTAVASISINGTTLTVTGIAAGTTAITICDQSNNCGSLSVTVSGSATTSGSLGFSQTNPSVGVGQSVTITLSGGTGYYISTNSNTNAVTLALNDNALTVTGVVAGTATLSVCSVTNGCGSITVTVGSSSSSSSSNTTTPTITFGSTNPAIAIGQSTTVSLSGGTGYFVSSNPSPNIAQASISGNGIVLVGVTTGSVTITVCATSGGCSNLFVTVTQAPTTTQTTTAQTTTVVSNSALIAKIQALQSAVTQVLGQIQSIQTQLAQLLIQANSTSITTNTPSASSGNYTFTLFLTSGSEGPEVKALQERLASLGFYSGPITSYYGALTEAAVKKFQISRGITPAVYVGPNTRAALNGQ